MDDTSPLTVDLTFNDMLAKGAMDQSRVMVFRHRPPEPSLRRVFQSLAATRPDVYDAYQQSHGERVEQSLQKATHIASFVGHELGKAIFMGLYEITGTKRLSHQEYEAVPAFNELKALGMSGLPKRDSVIQFMTSRVETFFGQWRGRLVVGWPGPELSWWRWADRNRFLIDSINPESVLEPSLPHWTELVLSWPELNALPRNWEAALAQWRGVYLITDTADGKAYVGSAYGEQNLLGRWTNYGQSGHGGNKRLRERDPKFFRFSILELVSPAMEPEQVIKCEGLWKSRLMTREYGLNDN